MSIRIENALDQIMELLLLKRKKKEKTSESLKIYNLWSLVKKLMTSKSKFEQL